MLPSMLAVVTLAILAGVTLAGLKFQRDLVKNIEKAKQTGLPYVISPYFGFGIVWKLVMVSIFPMLRRLPFTASWDWVHLMTENEKWRNIQVVEKKHGDTWLVVAPNMIYLQTSNAELGSQITSRKLDFLKPIERYRAMDFCGKNILTTEGHEWRRHKKIVGPSFSEKGNKLVFEESLRQTEGLMKLWSSHGSNTKQDIRVENTAPDTAVLSLHVICAAGFGLPQTWPGEPEEKLLGKGAQTFSGSELTDNHTLSFKESLDNFLKGLLWLAPLGPEILKRSPFRIHELAYRGFDESRAYFSELLETKQQQFRRGKGDEGTMDLMGSMIKASEEAPGDAKINILQQEALSRTEIIGNAFILFLGGHETTGNTLHYALLFLAMSPAIQRQMQDDIESIIGREIPISELSYVGDMPRLYGSMVGAVMNEVIRLIPPAIHIPKITNGDQKVVMDGRWFTIPDRTDIELNIPATNRNPRYWPQSPHEFLPSRWLKAAKIEANENTKTVANRSEQTSVGSSSSGILLTPVKGSFISFSDGARACPGKRLAQVEMTAVLSVIFRKYTVELDVSDWANDEEVRQMGKEKRREVYQKAIERSKGVIARSERLISLQMKAGDKVPLRFVTKGQERFSDT